MHQEITEIRLPFGLTRCFESGWCNDLDGGPGLALWTYRGNAPGPRRPPRLFTEDETQAYTDFEGFFRYVEPLTRVQITVSHADGRAVDDRQCDTFTDDDWLWGEQDDIANVAVALAHTGAEFGS